MAKYTSTLTTAINLDPQQFIGAAKQVQTATGGIVSDIKRLDLTMEEGQKSQEELSEAIKQSEKAYATAKKELQSMITYRDKEYEAGRLTEKQYKDLTKIIDNQAKSVRTLGRQKGLYANELNKVKTTQQQFEEKVKQSGRSIENLSKLVKGVEWNKIKNGTATVNELKKAIDGIDKQIEIDVKTTDKIDDSLISAGKKIGAGSLAVGTLAVKEFATYEEGLAFMATLTGETLDDMKNRYDKSFKEIASNTGASLKELTEGAYEALSSSVPEDQVSNFMEIITKGAKSGKATIADTTKLMTSIVNTYGMAYSEVGLIMDKLLITQNLGNTTVDEMASSLGQVTSIAKDAGVEFDELLTAVATLTKRGLSTAEATTAIRSFLSSILKPTDGATNLAETLNFDFNLSNLQEQGLIGFMLDINKTIESINPRAEELQKQLQSVSKEITLLEQVKSKTYGQKQTLKALREERSEVQKKIKALEKAGELQIEAQGQFFGNVRGMNAASMLSDGANDYKDIATRIENAFGETDRNFTTLAESSSIGFQKALNNVKIGLAEVGEQFKGILDSLTKGLKKLGDFMKDETGSKVTAGTLVGGTLVGGAATGYGAWKGIRKLITGQTVKNATLSKVVTGGTKAAATTGVAKTVGSVATKVGATGLTAATGGVIAKIAAVLGSIYLAIKTGKEVKKTYDENKRQNEVNEKIADEKGYDLEEFNRQQVYIQGLMKRGGNTKYKDIVDEAINQLRSEFPDLIYDSEIIVRVKADDTDYAEWLRDGEIQRKNEEIAESLGMDYTEVMASINEYNSKMGDNLYQELSDGTLKLKPQFAQMYNDIKELMNAGFSVPVKFNMINTPFTSGFSSSINAPSIFAPRIRSFSGGADIGTPDVAPIGDGLNLGGLVRSAREMTSVANATGGSAVSSGLTINQGVVSEPKQDNTLPTDVKVVVESTPITITLDGNVLAREIIPKVERYQDLKYRNARRGGGL